MADKENNDGSNKSVKGLIESVGSIVNSINSLQVTKEASKNNEESCRIGNGLLNHGLAYRSIPELDMMSEENTNGRCKRLPTSSDFVNDDATDDDVIQGKLGDCWFLSALASLTVELPEKARMYVFLKNSGQVPLLANRPTKYDSVYRKAAAENVIQKTHNNMAIKCNQTLNFRFFRMGEWVNITVDSIVPTSRRARQSKTKEWWVPLTEKAYAKFHGSYDNIVGGKTAWALTELTGGVAAEMELSWEIVNKLGRDKLKAFIRKYLHGKGIFCTSNLTESDDNDQSGIFETNGLVKAHAYSMLNIEDVETSNGTVSLVRIRNPYGKVEWNGPWSDKSPEWETVSEETKQSIEHSAHDDGEFFMSFDDWINEFERFTTCYIIGDSDVKLDTRAIGILVPGQNAGTIAERRLRYNLQFTLKITEAQDVWIQTLQEAKSLKEESYVMLQLYKCDKRHKTKRNLRKDTLGTYIDPLFPKNRERSCVQYSHNGWVYQLEAGNYFIALVYYVSDQRKYMFRAIGKDLKLESLAADN